MENFRTMETDTLYFYQRSQLGSREVNVQEIRNLVFTRLLRERIGDTQCITPVWLVGTEEARYICRPSRAWLILESLVICLYLFVIDPHFDLAGERYVQPSELRERLLRSAEK